MPDTAEISGFLKKNLPGYQEIRFEIVSTPKTFNVIRIDTTAVFRTAGNYGYLPVYVYNQKNSVTKSVVTLKLKLFKNVLCAVRAIKKGETMNPNDMVPGIKDVAEVKGELAESDFILGSLPKRNIDPGSVLVKEFFEAIPVIKKGDRVIAFSSRGSVEISFDANARQDGAPGKIIRISSENNQIYKARVIDSHMVQVVE